MTCWSGAFYPTLQVGIPVFIWTIAFGLTRFPMNVVIAESWKAVLQPEFDKPYFSTLAAFLREEYSTETVYPPGRLMFNAFDKCSFADTRVVILGQDPYHGPGQANGLAFSVADGIPKPPSLLNVFKELQSDLGLPVPQSGNLERWAAQGVMLLNATLTVRAGQAGSHQGKGWETFTDAVIKLISDQKKDVVFMLWGAYAQKKRSRHRQLQTLDPEDPTPLAHVYPTRGLVRQPPLQPGQRVSDKQRTGPDCVVMAFYSITRKSRFQRIFCQKLSGLGSMDIQTNTALPTT
jgi:uracil-DNA glycosylase